MNVNSKEKIGAAFEECANAFDLFRESVNVDGERPSFIKIIDNHFFVTNKKANSNRDIIDTVSSLLERVLICPDYMPSRATMEKLQKGVQEFIARSKKLSPEEKAQDISLSYFKEFLLGPALEKKVNLAEKMHLWQTKAGNSSSIQKILGAEITKCDQENPEDLRAAALHGRKQTAHLLAAKLHLYVIQKLLASSLTYQKYHRAYIDVSNTGIAKGGIRHVVEAADQPGNSCFNFVLDYGNLFDDMGLLAMRMRTEKILQKDCFQKGNQNTIFKHIRSLLDIKDKDIAKAPQVDACLAFLRTVNLANGNKHMDSLDNLHRDTRFWDKAVDESEEDERTCDTMLTSSYLVGLSLRTLVSMESQFDRVFGDKKENLFKEGNKEKVLEIISFQQSKRKCLWSLMENCVSQWEKVAEKNAAIYRNIDQKMRAFISEFPTATDRNIATRMAIDTVSLTIDGEKPRPSLDFSLKEYANSEKEISNYAKPVVSMVDLLIEQAKTELQDEKEQKLVKSIQSLSIKTEKTQPPTPSKKPPKKQPAKQVSVKTDTAAKNLIIVCEPEIVPQDMQLVGKGGRVKPTQPKVFHSSFTYHPRVTRWWSDKEKDDPFLNDPEYKDKGFSQKAKEWIRAKHNFGTIVDQFLNREGIKYKTGQRVLVGEIIRDGETRQGIFGYAQGTQNHDKELYYHRFFTEKTPSKIIAEYANRGGYKLDGYAEDQKAQQKLRIKKPLSDDGSFVKDITDDVIIICDPKNDMEIRICRFQEQDQ